MSFIHLMEKAAHVETITSTLFGMWTNMWCTHPRDSVEEKVVREQLGGG